MRGGADDGARFFSPPLPPPLPSEEERFAPPLPPSPAPPLPPSVACAGMTKQGRPCRVSWDLDRYSFCKYHETQRHVSSEPPPPPLPPPVTCAGITKQGRPCRVNWDLDAYGFCKYHIKQRHGSFEPPPRLPPPPPPRRVPKPPPRTCAGTTKQGLPCKIAWQLDALGFCKYHTQLTRQCRGVAVSTGQQCRIRWDLDANGFCKYHTAQAALANASNAPPSQCVALAQSTGQRCRITTGLDADGVCSVHQRTSRTATRVLTAEASATSSSSQRCRCGGVVFLTGARCTNDAKPDYGYCCAAHDPSLQYFSPRLFDAGDRPRSLLEPQVVRLYDGHDLYHGDLLDLVTPGAVELDHILEKQCFAFAFHGVPFEDVANDAAYLATIVREQFANELDNVCLTRTTTNKIKGSAVWKFLDDTITGHLAPASSISAPTQSHATFTDYMLAEQRDDKRLDRTTTRVITREMGRVLKMCQRKLADQGETPLVDALGRQLQDVYINMDLHSSSYDSLSKYDARARSRERIVESAHDEPRKIDERPAVRKSTVESDQSKPSETAEPPSPGQRATSDRDGGDSLQVEVDVGHDPRGDRVVLEALATQAGGQDNPSSHEQIEPAAKDSGLSDDERAPVQQAEPAMEGATRLKSASAAAGALTSVPDVCPDDTRDRQTIVYPTSEEEVSKPPFNNPPPKHAEEGESVVLLTAQPAPEPRDVVNGKVAGA